MKSKGATSFKDALQTMANSILLGRPVYICELEGVESVAYYNVKTRDQVLVNGQLITRNVKGTDLPRIVEVCAKARKLFQESQVIEESKKRLLTSIGGSLGLDMEVSPAYRIQVKTVDPDKGIMFRPLDHASIDHLVADDEMDLIFTKECGSGRRQHNCAVSQMDAKWYHLKVPDGYSWWTTTEGTILTMERTMKEEVKSPSKQTYSVG